MRYALFILFFINNLHGAAQSNQLFSGIVLDKATKTPVPWATVLVRGTAKGTVTNAEGKFLFSFTEKKDSIVVQISSIGYKSNLVQLSTNYEKKILLEQGAKLLNEVIVRPQIVRDMVREAVKKIAKNYYTKPIVLTGFYRESLRYDSTHYIYLTEGVLQARKESYRDAHHGGQIKLLKSRKKRISRLAQHYE